MVVSGLLTAVQQSQLTAVQQSQLTAVWIARGQFCIACQIAHI